MSVFLPFKKATLLVPSGPANDPNRKHLFILLTGPTLQDAEQRVLMVSFSSHKPGLYVDPACLVDAGEHPFIRKPSFVAYSKARIESAEALLRGVKNGKLIQHAQATAALFERICHGLTVSQHTARRVIVFYNMALDQERR